MAQDFKQTSLIGPQRFIMARLCCCLTKNALYYRKLILKSKSTLKKEMDL